MARISFFTMLADDTMSRGERDAINAAGDRADAAMEVASAQGEALGQAISALQRRVADQDQQIKLLRAAVGVLAAMLRDTGTVDGDLLDMRLEAAIANAEEELEEEATTTTCLHCGQQIDRRRTVVTEIGVLCDRCHARG